MKPSRQRVVLGVVLLALTAILVLLAALQYRWSREVSDAAGARMQANLAASMMGFRQDFHRELAGVASVLQESPGEGPHDRWARYARQYETWARTAIHPALVANVFVWEDVNGRHPRLLRLNVATYKFEPDSWSFRYDPLPERLRTLASQLPFIPNPERRQDVPPAAARDQFYGPKRGGFPALWGVEQSIPALIRPVIDFPGGEPKVTKVEPAAVSWIVVELNTAVLQQHLLPELVERYFAGPDGLDYRVAIVADGDQRRRVVYSSDADFANPKTAAADAAVNIFGPMRPPRPPGTPPPRGSGFPMFFGPPGGGKTANRLHDREAGVLGGLRARLEPIHYTAEGGDWQLLVQHRKGSLVAVVAAMRHRNLAISAGVLIILAITMALVIVTSQRAQRLARLQMDFVAGVSHELRTPLAVIGSAADNIADGVVHNPEQLSRYAGVIKKQAKQLTALVEQILMFAASRQHQAYVIRPIEAAAIVDTAVSNTAELIHNAGFTVDRHVPANLPRVAGDLPALAQSLQNLITNAVKYGGEQRWIGIRATANADGKCVDITVADRGLGIRRSELEHIFEPFYRSRAATDAQIHGTGLGLPLARTTVEAMGGTLTATSEPGHGSSFTLRLPVCEEARLTAAPEIAAATSATSVHQA